jgi:hypothetical protein
VAVDIQKNHTPLVEEVAITVPANTLTVIIGVQAALGVGIEVIVWTVGRTVAILAIVGRNKIGPEIFGVADEEDFVVPVAITIADLTEVDFEADEVADLEVVLMMRREDDLVVWDIVVGGSILRTVLEVYQPVVPREISLQMRQQVLRGVEVALHLLKVRGALFLASNKIF